MKHSFLITLFMGSMLFSGVASCAQNESTGNIETSEGYMAEKILITINSQTFVASLFDNDSGKAFRDRLPMTITMVELNGNEKYYDLPQSLPTNSSNPGSIKNGDLMLYGSRTLVLFYKNFSTSYSYTRLGKIDDASGLASDLGAGNVTITFELE